MPGLNHKQKAFATFYVTPGPTLGNATKSAEAAGYSVRTAYAQGSDLLKHPEVAKLIAAGAEKTVERISRKGADILEELARLGFSDVSEFYSDCRCDKCGCSKGGLKHPRDMSPKARAAIASFEEEDLFEGNHEDTSAGEDGGRFWVGKIRKVKLWSKEKGLELLGKHLKLFTDKVELSGNVNIAVVDPYAKKPVKK